MPVRALITALILAVAPACTSEDRSSNTSGTTSVAGTRQDPSSPTLPPCPAVDASAVPRIVELIERVERSTVQATSELVEFLELTPQAVLGLCEPDALDLCAAAGLECTALRRDDVSLTEPSDDPQLRRVWYEVDDGLVTDADYDGYAIEMTR